MNRYHDDIQDAIARLGDHLARVQLLVHDLAESRELADGEIDPEADLAIVCWLEEAAEVLGRPPSWRRQGKALP